MEQYPLISVITPCHNSASYLFRLLDSVLAQTYPRVEMIIVDNDSKDNTSEVIRSYHAKFINKGYSLKYIHQEDLGPSSGIQTGLRVINGDFLVMPDSDDFYNKDNAFEKWITKFQELGEEYAVIRCQLQLINEGDMSCGKVIYENATSADTGNLFEDCLFGNNGYHYAPIDYMVRVSHLRELTGMNIFNAYNVGQQRQICMPLYYKYKAYTILEPLACYLVRNSSISHGDYAKYPTQRKLYNLSLDYIDSILACCRGMSSTDMDDYRRRYLQMRSKDMMLMALRYNIKDDVQIYINDYLTYGGDKSEIEKTIKNFKLHRLLVFRIYNSIKSFLYRCVK